MAEVRLEVKAPFSNLLFNFKRFRKGVVKEVNKSLTQSRRDLKNLTGTWQPHHRPRIVVNWAHRRGGSITGSVTARGKIFSYLNDGTPGHFVPKRGKATMTPRPYHAGTYPGSLNFVGRWGGFRSVRTGRWRVSGIKPRDFMATLRDKYQPQLEIGVLGILRTGFGK